MIYKRGCNKKGPNETCSKCGERGACGVYWYKFMWQGKLVRESTKQGNDKVARQMEAAHRTSLAKGEVGIRERKPSPTLAEFYSLRHSFLTRLAESGCDVWTLSRIAGHASLTMSQRYIHPSQDAVLDAMARSGGHKIGHNEKGAPQLPVATIAASTVQ